MMKIIYNKEKKYLALVYAFEGDTKLYITFDRKVIYTLIKKRKLDKERLYRDGVISLD